MVNSLVEKNAVPARRAPLHAVKTARQTPEPKPVAKTRQQAVRKKLAAKTVKAMPTNMVLLPAKRKPAAVKKKALTPIKIKLLHKKAAPERAAFFIFTSPDLIQQPCHSMQIRLIFAFLAIPTQTG